MGQCLKICEGTFCLKMAESIAILVISFSILMLNQFSRGRKMRIKLANLQSNFNLQNIYILQVITVLNWKIPNFANFPT